MIKVPPPPGGQGQPLSYQLNQAREEAYRRAKEELQRLFPDIDLYTYKVEQPPER